MNTGIGVVAQEEDRTSLGLSKNLGFLKHGTSCVKTITRGRIAKPWPNYNPVWLDRSRFG